MILKRAVILRDRLFDQLINVDLIGDFFGTLLQRHKQ